MKKKKPNKKRKDAPSGGTAALVLTVGGPDRCELEVKKCLDAPALGNMLALTALSYRDKMLDDYPVKALVAAVDVLESSGAIEQEGGSEPTRVYFLEVMEVISLYTGVFYAKEINSPRVKTPDLLKAIRWWTSEYWRDHFFKEEQDDLLEFTKKKMEEFLKDKQDKI